MGLGLFQRCQQSCMLLFLLLGMPAPLQVGFLPFQLSQIYRVHLHSASTKLPNFLKHILQVSQDRFVAMPPFLTGV